MTHQDKQQGDEPSGIKNSHRVALPADDTDTTAADHDPGKTAQERAKQALGTAEKEVSVLLGQAKERLEPLDSWVKMTAQEHPYLSLSSVLGAGFLAGVFMRRRTAVGLGLAIGFVGGCLISGSGVKGAQKTRKA